MEEMVSPERVRPEPLSVLWRVFASSQMLLALLALLAAILALSTLIPQIPPQAVDDPQAWMAVQPGIFGQRNGLIRAVGLFDIYHAWWFHLALALTGLTLFVHLVESAELAWRATGSGRWQPEALAHWGRRPTQVRLPARPADWTLDRFRDFFAARDYHWSEVPNLPTPNAVVSRRGATLWARPIAYGAFLAALLGLVIGAAWGWETGDWQMVPSETHPLDHSSPLSMRLDAFEPAQARANPCDYESQIAWLEGDVRVAQSTVSARQPASFRGIVARQVGFAPTVRVGGRDAAGRPLALQAGEQAPTAAGEVEITFPSAQAQSLVLVPLFDLYLGFTFEPPTLDRPPALHIAALRSGEETWQPLGTLHQSGSILVDNLLVDVLISYQPILRLDRRPAAGLLFGGLALAVLALAVSWLASPKLVWLAIGAGEGESSVVQVFGLPGAGGSAWWPPLVERLGEVLDDDA